MSLATMSRKPCKPPSSSQAFNASADKSDLVREHAEEQERIKDLLLSLRLHLNSLQAVYPTE